MLTIGQSYQGGILAYILQPMDIGYDFNTLHGLIAAPSDQSSGASWGCWGTLISGADGTGKQNTIDIMAGCSEAGIAAKLCGDFTLNGYSDWYLPSKAELNKLFLNKKAIGGFANYLYWSSTQSNNSSSWGQDFVTGSQLCYGKFRALRVRAIRAF